MRARKPGTPPKVLALADGASRRVPPGDCVRVHPVGGSMINVSLAIVRDHDGFVYIAGTDDVQ